jgi:hypothetical protein
VRSAGEVCCSSIRCGWSRASVVPGCLSIKRRRAHHVC